MSKKSQAREYLTNHVKKPLELVIKRVLKKKPTDPIPLILGAFEELQGSVDNPMTDLEREELNSLRYEHDALKVML